MEADRDAAERDPVAPVIWMLLAARLPHGFGVVVCASTAYVEYSWEENHAAKSRVCGAVLVAQGHGCLAGMDEVLAYRLNRVFDLDMPMSILTTWQKTCTTGLSNGRPTNTAIVRASVPCLTSAIRHNCRFITMSLLCRERFRSQNLSHFFSWCSIVIVRGSC